LLPSASRVLVSTQVKTVAVTLDTNHANAFVIDAVEQFCPQGDQREMHDVFIVISELRSRTHRADGLRRQRRRRAPHTPGKLCRRAHRGGSSITPSRLVTSGGVRHHTEPFGRLEDATDAYHRITRRRQ